MQINRGDIFYAYLGQTLGSEENGYRPVLVVQNDIGNRYSPTVIVLPLSSRKKKYLPVHIGCNEDFLPKNSVILAEQIRTIDRKRLDVYLGKTDEITMRKVDNALKISLGIEELSGEV